MRSFRMLHVFGEKGSCSYVGGRTFQRVKDGRVTASYGRISSIPYLRVNRGWHRMRRVLGDHGLLPS